MQAVLQPVDPVLGIQVEENNHIVLPVDIFTTNGSGEFADRLPWVFCCRVLKHILEWSLFLPFLAVRVASLFFKNLFLLLLPNEYVMHRVQ